MDNKELSFEEQFDKYLESIKELDRREASLFENYDYINWLENFSKRFPFFTTGDFNGDNHLVDDYDKEMISNLILFYNRIKNHAKKIILRLILIEKIIVGHQKQLF